MGKCVSEWLLMVTLAWLLWGCSSSKLPTLSEQSPELMNSENSEKGTVVVRIYWPEVKTRMMPDLAKSIRVWMRRYGIIIAESPVLTRPSGAATVEYRFTGVPISVGERKDTYVIAAAYPNTDGTGVILAYGSSPEFAVRSGVNPVQSIRLVSTVAKIQIIVPENIRVGSTFNVQAIALNAKDEQVPVPPFNWSIILGRDVLEFVGSTTGQQVTLRALKAGTARIRAVTEQQSGNPESIASGEVDIEVKP
jgi:hypothetical protein